MKFSKETRKKALETKAKNEGVVCKIGDIKISADQNQYILTSCGMTTYHPSINAVLDELLEHKEKQLMIASKNKDLLSVKKSIEDAREWMNIKIKPILK